MFMLLILFFQPLHLFCCYFGGSPKMTVSAVQNWDLANLEKKKKKKKIWVLLFLPRCFPGDSQRADFKCWVQGNVRHGPSVSLKRCKSSSASFGCLFPSGASQIVSRRAARTQSPGESPNIQGIKRHLACESLPLFLTLRAAFYFPFPRLLPSSRLLSTTNVQSHHFDFP